MTMSEGFYIVPRKEIGQILPTKFKNEKAWFPYMIVYFYAIKDQVKPAYSKMTKMLVKKYSVIAFQALPADNDKDVWLLFTVRKKGKTNVRYLRS